MRLSSHYDGHLPCLSIVGEESPSGYPSFTRFFVQPEIEMAVEQGAVNQAMPSRTA
jgi:hypothetical protein